MTSPISFLDGRVLLYAGDCREAIRALPDNSIDSVVTDPPYALVSIVKRFGKTSQSDDTDTSDRSRRGADGYARLAKGFMGKEWDNGDTAFAADFWADVLRVLKPGGHVVSFSGTRTYHRMACAMEDAGFEIRDQIGWLYGSGFPKSHDVSKGIDKARRRDFVQAAVDLGVDIPGRNFADWTKEGHAPGDAWWHEFKSALPCDLWNAIERKVIGAARSGDSAWFTPGASDITAPATDEARNWQGWGTALKPAWEPICLARKPIIGTVAANVLAHGTGALNIDGCRVGTDDTRNLKRGGGNDFPHEDDGWTPVPVLVGSASGRWPANVIHDGSDEVLAAFPATGASSGADRVNNTSLGSSGHGVFGQAGAFVGRGHSDDGGSAARFFYTVEREARCDLCRVLLNGAHAIESPCDATTAEPTSSTRNTLNGASVRADAAGLPPLESEARNHLSNGHAHNAANHSPGCLRPALGTAQSDALTREVSRIVPSVRFAANLCGSCETDIAQSLAATRLGLSPASLPCLDSMPERSAQILRQHLALYVAGRESTDTITTTASLKTLFGSVFHAIANTTSSGRSGSAANTEAARSRLFYSSKADAVDRIGSKHPTVKPLDLMQYLCRLVTPPGGTVLDPFAGTGTTGEAAWREGFKAILIEREPEYQADIARRMDLALKPAKRAAVAKTKNNLQGAEGTPLFGGEAA